MAPRNRPLRHNHPLPLIHVPLTLACAAFGINRWGCCTFRAATGGRTPAGCIGIAKGFSGDRRPEMEEVVLLPGEPDVDFDDNIFEEEPEGTPAPPEPAPAPAPEPEPAPAPAPATRQPRYLWCLDNGHGSKTAGKRSPLFDDGETRFFEYEFNRDIVRRIIKQLDKEGVRYFNVVPEVDTDNFLQGRVDRANKKRSDIPKLFVSVHANAGYTRTANDWTADSVSGIETWYFHGSKRGQKMASIFHKYLIEKTGFRNRHLKSQPEKQFFVLRKTMMTAILTENGFYNNKREALELMKDEVRQQIADAHVAAILEIEENGL
ncbi:MAG: N-acetylmuramoyl-L-alanine amidase [Saprospiraceae bacterium]